MIYISISQRFKSTSADSIRALTKTPYVTDIINERQKFFCFLKTNTSDKTILKKIC